MPYQLTEEVTVRGLHEGEADGQVSIVPFESNAGYLWTHAATVACLEHLATADVEGKTVLDFGCGHAAILGLASARVFGAGRVTFVENDPRVRETSARSLEINGLPPKVLKHMPRGHWDYALANVGDVALVDRVKAKSAHGVGTRRDGSLITW
jgi:ribosomal protein L11 methyltransferase